MPISLERLCNDLNRHGLLPPADIRNLRTRWLCQAGAAASDPVSFANWLIHHRLLTDYQANVLLGRRDGPLALGPYKIRGRISRGRLVGVYEVVGPRGQAVAIKVLPPARAADPTVLARFQREARLAMRLHHPHVIRTFEADEHRGTHYLVMELLQGDTLKDVLLSRGRLPLAEAIRLLYQALLGLQHIHEKGMVHRDLEPANLMLVPGGTETTLGSTVKILDIGVGRAVFDESAPGNLPVQLTSTGDQLGTPLYCAPEQAKDARQADIRSDIYSLGCVLYHALAGQPPFEDRGPVRLALSHANEPPPRLASLNFSVPAGLQAVLDSMLAKDPALRFPTLGHTAHELRPFLMATEGDTVRSTEPLQHLRNKSLPAPNQLNTPPRQAKRLNPVASVASSWPPLVASASVSGRLRSARPTGPPDAVPRSSRAGFPRQYPTGRLLWCRVQSRFWAGRWAALR